MTPDPIGDEAGYFAVSGSALKDPRRYEYIMAQAEAIREATGLKPILALSRDYKMTLRAMMKWPRGSYARIPSDARYAQVTGVFCALSVPIVGALSYVDPVGGGGNAKCDPDGKFL